MRKQPGLILMCVQRVTGALSDLFLSYHISNILQNQTRCSFHCLCVLHNYRMYLRVIIFYCWNFNSQNFLKRKSRKSNAVVFLLLIIYSHFPFLVWIQQKASFFCTFNCVLPQSTEIGLHSRWPLLCPACIAMYSKLLTCTTVFLFMQFLWMSFKMYYS